MHDIFTSSVSFSFCHHLKLNANCSFVSLHSLPSFHARFGVYVPLCCFHQEGGKSQTAATDCDYPADHQQSEFTETPFFRPRDFLFLLRENLREQFSSPPHMPIHTCPPHTHSHTPELIRAEVEELKSDFNRRIKEVLFNSLFSAYYVAFLPLCFVKVCIGHIFFFPFCFECQCSKFCWFFFATKLLMSHHSFSTSQVVYNLACVVSNLLVSLSVSNRVIYSHRALSTMTCAGHVSIW